MGLTSGGWDKSKVISYVVSFGVETEGLGHCQGALPGAILSLLDQNLEG